MDKPSGISIEEDNAGAATGNLLPLLHELRHALSRYRDAGQEHVVDLKSLPMSEAELHELQRLLGHGEVAARMQALGESEITETRIPAVWWINHYNADRALVGQFIEVTDCPEILKTQRGDIAEGIQDLEQLIAACS